MSEPTSGPTDETPGQPPQWPPPEPGQAPVEPGPAPTGPGIEGYFPPAPSADAPALHEPTPPEVLAEPPPAAQGTTPVEERAAADFWNDRADERASEGAREQGDGQEGSEEERSEESEGMEEEPQSTAALRERLVEQFTAWLDRMLVEEPPPDGVPMELLADALEAAAGRGGPPDPSADVYALYSALTGLTGEIRLQGRAFKQLADALAPLSALSGRLDQLESAQLAAADELGEMANLARAQAAQAAQAGGAGLPKAEEALTVLFDLYDRLERAERTLETLDELNATPRRRPAPAAPPTGWFDRLLGRRPAQSAAADDEAGGAGEPDESDEANDASRDEALSALREGYRLTLARLEGAFHQWGIERIGRAGEMFDPAHMAVVEIQPGDGAPDGTVLEVYRSGYALHGRVLATAQVKVAKG